MAKQGAVDTQFKGREQRVTDQLSLRDQWRARYAYTAVGSVPQDEQKEYKIAVNDLGANIMRSGFLAAVAVLERRRKHGDRLLKHLADAGLPGLERVNPEDFPSKLRKLDTDSYILATREALRIATWLKRATQALFEDN